MFAQSYNISVKFFKNPLVLTDGLAIPLVAANASTVVASDEVGTVCVIRNFCVFHASTKAMLARAGKGGWSSYKMITILAYF